MIPQELIEVRPVIKRELKIDGDEATLMTWFADAPDKPEVRKFSLRHLAGILVMDK